MRDNYLFESKKDALAFMVKHINNMTSFNINQMFYLVWSHYAGSYGQDEIKNPEGITEYEFNYPKWLCPAEFYAEHIYPTDFEAKYIIDSFVENNELLHFEPDVKPEYQDACLFIKEKIDYFNNVYSTFGLVEATMEDTEIVKHCMSNTLMDNQSIKSDYTTLISIL